MARGTKKLTEYVLVQRLIGWLGWGYIRLVHATGRWDVRNDGAMKQLRAEGRPFVVAFWHGRLLMMPMAWRGHAHLVISRSRDGQLISSVIHAFKFSTIAGSTSKGASAALRAMIRALKNGGYVGITPDGPRGPLMRAADGAVIAASMAGVPIIPVSYCATRRKVLGSWDRFIIPYPFSRGIFVWGDPIEVPDHADAQTREAKRAELEQALNQLTAEADRLCGHHAPPPAGGDGS